MPILLALAAVCFLQWTIATRELPRGWYYAGSNVEDETALGGFGRCNNFPKKCVNDFPGKEGKLSLIAYPEEVVALGRFEATPVRLVNRTGKTVGFWACDSSLYIVQERLMENGQWQALEKFPETSCGNSFHRVFLEPNEYWEFVAPRHVGWRKTKLRFRLEPGGERGQGVALFSNEYEGGIEP